MTELTTSFRTCPLCEATCGLQIEVEDGAVKRIRGDVEDVFSHGYICPKGSSLKGLHEDPDRLTTPLLKVDGEFHEIDWATAFQVINDRLRAIIDEHGKDAVGLYSGNPWSHNYETIIYTPFLYGAIGQNRFAAASVDQRPREIVSSVHFGARTSFPVPDIDRTDYLVLLGTDPLESNGSIASAPDWPGRMAAVRERGGKLVVIDPRRSKSAEVADQYIPIIPGTDAALLAGLAHVLLFENEKDLGDAAAFVDGMDLVRSALKDFTPEFVGPWCGIDAAVIRALANEMVSAPSAALHGRIGTSLQDLATLAAWLIDIVNYSSGNLDRPGGAMFAKGAAFGLNTGGRPGVGRGTDYNTFHSRVRGLPGAFDQLPAACMAEEMETPGEGQIRGFITIAGNPVLSTPDSDRLVRALDSLDFMVSIDMYLNETTRHADVILPVPSPLERTHFDVSYYQFTLRNVANFSSAIFDVPEGMVPEWRTLLTLMAILQGQGPEPDIDATETGLAKLLVTFAVADEFSPIHGHDVDDVMAKLEPFTGPQRLLDLYLRIGPYGDGFGTNPGGLSLPMLMENPHGIDLGPLQPRIPEMLRTTTGRIDFATPSFVGDLDRLKVRMHDPRPDYVMIGRRDLRSNNSWEHNVRSLSKGKDRCVLLVSSRDAETLELVDGGRARVSTPEGAVTATVEISDAMMNGVVSLPHGWGHDLKGTRMAIASERPGVNSNKLASNDHVDPLSGNPHLNGIPVTIVAAD